MRGLIILGLLGICGTLWSQAPCTLPTDAQGRYNFIIEKSLKGASQAEVNALIYTGMYELDALELPELADNFLHKGEVEVTFNYTTILLAERENTFTFEYTLMAQEEQVVLTFTWKSHFLVVDGSGDIYWERNCYDDLAAPSSVDCLILQKRWNRMTCAVHKDLKEQAEQILGSIEQQYKNMQADRPDWY